MKIENITILKTNDIFIKAVENGDFSMWFEGSYISSALFHGIECNPVHHR